MDRFIGLIGIVVIIGIAIAMSGKRRQIQPRIIIWGLALQVLLAFILLRFPPGIEALNWLASQVNALAGYADVGARFIFGDKLMDQNTFGVIFVVKILPPIIFISSFFSILYYLGVMQWIVYGMAKVMSYLMGVSGSESLATAANVFMGQTEAPLIIAPYIREMTLSELLCLMTGGMATVSGSILIAYKQLGIDVGYLLTASIMAAPAAIMMAKLLMPETETSKTAGDVTMVVERTDSNIIDAAARGAAQGVQLAINVAAMLVAFIALIALLNGIIGGICSLFTDQKITLELVMGYCFSPLAFIMGVPWHEAVTVGSLLGKKIILNEFVAYADLAPMIKAHALSGKAQMIATYALCGFANFSSIGIQLGGIGPLAPNKKHDLARLGLRALLGGALATCLTATIAGIIGG